MVLLLMLIFVGVAPSWISAKIPAECNLPHSRGITTAEAFLMYTYNKQISECISFIYSGSGGNTNRFWSKRDCVNTCMPT
ncbi:hypothetical protein M5D96_003832 [Drosophila gunungcola]|uniref:BPTI/Kunitz inhibitor domain-containing protein n=1 Tax=Drosophila gunungcola TaxID=103775 RepID=A0A9P9YSU1_9MUSC|nr:hypothetical protein M5D96_003832 [Drosophila gunungcola]